MLEDWFGRTSIKQKIICINPGCNPSKSPERGGNNFPRKKHGVSQICGSFRWLETKQMTHIFLPNAGIFMFFSLPKKKGKKYLHLLYRTTKCLVPLKRESDRFSSIVWLGLILQPPETLLPAKRLPFRYPKIARLAQGGRSKH